MAPVISPLFSPDSLSNPPILDLLPSHFAESSHFSLPRPATPWPLIPSSSVSSSPLIPLSEPDLLPFSLPFSSPMSIVGEVHPLDFGLLSSSPVPLSFSSRDASSAFNLSSPSLDLFVTDGLSIDPVLMEVRTALSPGIDPSSAIISSSSTPSLSAPDGLSPVPVLVKGPSDFSPGFDDIISSDVRDGIKCLNEQSVLGGPVAFPVCSSLQSYSLAPSKQCPSSPVPLENALNPGINCAAPRSQYAGSDSCPMGVSWASVVEKRIIGGKSSLQFFPPNCPDMENIILSPPPEVTQQSANLWDSTLVGYFVGNPVHFNAVNNITRKIWKRFELQHVAGDESGFFFFRFSSVSMLEKCLACGPWIIADHPFFVKKWWPGMILTREEHKSFPTWITMSGIPFEYWTPLGLSWIASAVGKPLFLDPVTEKLERLGFARVCVEMKINAPRPESIKIRASGCAEHPADHLCEIKFSYQHRPVHKAAPVKNWNNKSSTKTSWVPKREAIPRDNHPPSDTPRSSPRPKTPVVAAPLSLVLDHPAISTTNSFLALQDENLPDLRESHALISPVRTNVCEHVPTFIRNSDVPKPVSDVAQDASILPQGPVTDDFSLGMEGSSTLPRTGCPYSCPEPSSPLSEGTDRSSPDPELLEAPNQSPQITTSSPSAIICRDSLPGSSGSLVRVGLSPKKGKRGSARPFKKSRGIKNNPSPKP